ncbi:uncharacterized protein LOC134281636 [Saccostrea cucullata]|uniref:uncharacterized protein LOC134281636 n=1 Tax=Saccostrea cuccullata TaxID=36930 RepID=UPI002ED2C893
MEVAKNLTFMFHPLETNDEKEPKKIQEIIQNIPERNTVSVLAKVIAVKQESVQEVRKVLLKKKEITIADETSMISLTLWDTLVDDPNISLNAVIFFRNISTRLFSNVKSLTTTKDTTYELTENQTAFQGVDENTYITESKTATVEGEVVNILIKKTNHCLSCNRKMLETETKSQFIKCAGCNMKFKVSAMDTTLTSTFQIKTNENTIKLNAYNATLMHFLISVQKEHLKNDPDELENFLLLLPRVKVEYAKGENVVSKISVLT